MPRLWAASPLAIGVLLGGCPAPSYNDFESATAPTPTGATTDTTGTLPADPLPTTTVPGPETTTDAPATSTGARPPDGSTTEAEPPPTIVDIDLAPPVLQAPGELAISVQAEHTATVMMQLPDQPPVELLETAPGVFTDALAFYSSLANDTYTATFIPSRPGVTGDDEVRAFTVNLPAAGTEVFWEAVAKLGEGSVAALAVLPGGDLVEFGTLTTGPRCYLRRRAPSGAWDDADVTLLPDLPCRAIDLGVTSDGALYLLTDRTGDGDLSWWLGRKQSLGAPPENIRFGAAGEEAHALAMHPAAAAVCGTQPTKKVDLADATAWIVPFDAPGSVLHFDYQPAGKENQFKETPRDCAFAGDTLVLVGEARGQHEIGNINAPILDRLFVLEYDTITHASTWTVDGAPADLIQSTAHSLTIDDQGRYLTGGHRCGVPCDPPVAELRRFSPGGAQTWQLDLAPKLTAPRRLAWSPAGYLVLVSAANKGPWTSDYFIQAWIPGVYPAMWSYDKNVAPTLHMAHTVTIGLFGQVYTGGVGANHYPAVAFIHG